MRGALNLIPTIGGEESQGARSRRQGEGYGGLILPQRHGEHGVYESEKKDVGRSVFSESSVNFVSLW